MLFSLHCLRFLAYFACLCLVPRAWATDLEDEGSHQADPNTPAKAEEEEDWGDELDDEFKLLDMESLLAEPTVESVSRRVQGLDDAPASVSVLTAEEIAASGATNIADLLRRIPGVFVLQVQANTYSVGLRGINPLRNNRLLVAVDGRRLSGGNDGTLAWSEFPIHPGDIEKIEVIRGPGSTLYGANALTGVINITTKRPIDTPGLEAAAWGGLAMLRQDNPEVSSDLWLSDIWMSSGGRAYAAHTWVNEDENLGLRLSAQLGQNPEWPDASKGAASGMYHYSVMASLEARPSPDWDLLVQVAHGSSKHLTAADTASVSFFDNHWNAVFNFQMEKRRFWLDSLTLKAGIDAKHEETDFNPPLDIRGTNIGEMIHGKNVGFEMHGYAMLDWDIFEGRNILSLGAEASLVTIPHFVVESTAWFGGLMLNNETQLFADGRLSLHLGGRLEYIHSEPELAGVESTTYRHFSPRGALIWKISNTHSLRLSGASSFRTPTLYELYMEVTPQLSDPPLPPHKFLMGNPRLRPEKLYSIELGYRGMPWPKLRVDAVFFGQQIEDIISDIPLNFIPVYRDNVGAVDQLGVELGATYVPTETLSLYLNYTFLYSRDRQTDQRTKEWPGHLYGLGGELRLPFRSRLNLDAYLVFDYRPTVSFFAGIDSPNPYVGWERRQAADQALVNLRWGKFFYEDKGEFFLMLKNILGFVRRPDGLRMQPLESLQPLGGTVLMGIQVKGI